MKHYGNITKIHGDQVPIVDIITGGSPCQDLSVAGRREGLDGERSGLFFEQIRIIKEMRDYDRRVNGKSGINIRPRFMVFENVCGVFSSGNPIGEDFRIILEETARIADSNATIPRLPDGQTWSYSGAVMGDNWSIAWRVHSAEFWGCAQRRYRVALVADFGSQCAPPILFERESVSRDLESLEQERQGTSPDSERGIGESSFTFKFRGGSETDSKGRKAGKGALIQDELSGTIGAVQDQTLVTSKCYGISPYESNAMNSGNPNSGIYEAESARTLDENGGNPACNQGGIAIVEPATCYSQFKYDKYLETETSASIKQAGGNIGGGSETIVKQSAPCVRETTKE